MPRKRNMICNLVCSALVLVALVWLVPRLLGYLMPFVIGYVFSLIAGPIVRFLEKHINIKRKYGSVLMVSLTIALIALACYGAGRIVLVVLQGVLTMLPSLAAGAENDVTLAVTQFQEWYNALPLADIDLSALTETITGMIGSLVNEAPAALFGLGKAVKNLPDMVVYGVVSLLAAYFFTAQRESLLSWCRRHLPQGVQQRIGMLWRQTLGAVGGYFHAQFKIMIVVYVALVIGLAVLRIDFAWLIGLGIAFLDMLPIFGTGTVLIPWALIELFAGDWRNALGMLLLYGITFLIHQLIQPKLLGDSMGMDPFAALFFMYVGYRANSVVGMIVAIPVGMVAINLVKAGAFDTQIYCVKQLALALRDACHVQLPQKKE